MFVYFCIFSLLYFISIYNKIFFPLIIYTMKISGLHLFIILFGSLLLTYSLGTFMREGFTDSNKKLIIDIKKLSPTAQQSLNKFLQDQTSDELSYVTVTNDLITIDSSLLSPSAYNTLNKFISDQIANNPSFSSAFPSGSTLSRNNKLSIDTSQISTLANQDLNKLIYEFSTFPISVSNDIVTIDSSMLSPSAYNTLSNMFSADPSLYSALSTPFNFDTSVATSFSPTSPASTSHASTSPASTSPASTSPASTSHASTSFAATSQASSIGPYPSFSPSSQKGPYPSFSPAQKGPYPSFSPAQTGPYPSFSPPTSQASSIGPYPSSMSKSITGKLTQMFDNVKNKLEGAVTDNNTNVYNYSQQRYDSYQGKAGDTVIVSPPPPQTIGLPSSSSPSPYPFPAPPPPQFNQNKNALGIPYSQIPQGQMDLYILKSEVIPPVCPACPNITACASKEPPPPCPPCARCPEPAFECKKVPNYRGGDNNYLPLPVLADFSQFGM